MRINFEYKSKPGLKIIPQIMDGTIIWVRGYNGVGKSLAAKLLEIVSGDHVFDNRGEFESLKNALESATVTITRDETDELQIKVHPTNWTFDEFTRMIRHDTIGEYFEGEKHIQPNEFRDRFEARIIKGNESLPTQISSLITSSLENFRRLNLSVTDIEGLVKNFVNEMTEELQLGALETYKKTINQLDKQQKALNDTVENLSYLNNYMDLLLELTNIQENIALLEQYDASSIIDEVSLKEKRIDELNNSFRKLMKNRDELSFKLKQLVISESQNYEYTLSGLKRARSDLNKILEHVINACDELEIDILASATTDELIVAIDNRESLLTEEEEELNQKKVEVLITDDILQAQRLISQALTVERDQYDIGSEIIAHGKVSSIRKELDLTASELKNMVENQEVVVLKKREDSAFRDFEAEIKEISTKQDKLESLRQLAKKRKRTEEKNDRLEDALSSLKVSRKPEFHDLKSQIESIDREIQQIHIERANLSRMIDDLKETKERYEKLPSLDELKGNQSNVISRLEPLEKQIDLSDVKTLELEYNDSQSLALIKRKEIRDIKHAIINLQKERQALQNIFDRTVHRLEEDHQFKFLSDWLRSLNGYGPLEVLRRLDKHINNFLETVSELKLRFKDVEDFHEELLNIQMQQPTRLSSAEGLKSLELIFNTYFKEFYNNPIFLKYVLEGFVKIDTFNLRTNEISLVDADGDTQIRPITAFSTGQKAFAFSIAMMSIVFSRPSKSRVLVLDEFGALLDFMREDVLIRQVKQKLVEPEFVNKIVILLPVRERLELELDNLNSQLKAMPASESKRIEGKIARVRRWLDQLKARGYYQYEHDENGQEEKSL